MSKYIADSYLYRAIGADINGCCGKCVQSRSDCMCHSLSRMDICGIIDDAPTVEVEEIKRGRWKIKAINTFDMAYGSTGYEPVYECSLCGAVEESYLRLDEPIMPEDADFPRYCPNCGARMDLEGDEE